MTLLLVVALLLSLPAGAHAAGAFPAAVSATADAASPELPGTAPPLRPIPDLNPIASYDAYLRGQLALESGDLGEAARFWKAAVTADPQSLPAQLALAGARLREDPALAAEAWRDAAALVLLDFRSQRWAVRHALLAVALGGTLACILVALGLVLRHARAVHHALYESLAWSLRPGIPARVLAVLAFCLPVLANLGPVGCALFWLFLSAYRLSRAERFLALVAAAWALLLGPSLSVCRPLWGEAPDGRDAGLLYEIQRDPALPAERHATLGWMAQDPEGAAANYLDGLWLLARGRGEAAGAAFHAAGATGEVPPDVLEADLGCAALLDRRPSEGVRHLEAAERHNPSSFAVRYDKGLALAALGRFDEADHALDAAGRIDLDRLRSLGRVEAGEGPRPLLPALWSRSDLWTWTFRHPTPSAPPALLAALFPSRSLEWSAPFCLLAILMGFLGGRWLGRLLSVRVCYQCGGPICRRCLVRLDRHAYCGRCSEQLGGAGVGETTRILLQRLLEDRPDPLRQAALRGGYLLPGIGACSRGAFRFGALAALLAGCGLALLFFASWGKPVLPMVADPLLTQGIRSLGAVLLVLSLVPNGAGIRGAERSSGSMRAFLNRDIERMAA